MTFHCFFKNLTLIAEDYGIIQCPPKNFNDMWCLIDKIIAAIEAEEEA